MKGCRARSAAGDAVGEDQLGTMAAWQNKSADGRRGIPNSATAAKNGGLWMISIKEKIKATAGDNRVVFAGR